MFPWRTRYPFKLVPKRGSAPGARPGDAPRSAAFERWSRIETEVYIPRGLLPRVLYTKD